MGHIRILGSVLEPSSWLEAAAQADGVVHTAAESGPRQREADWAAVETLVSLPAANRFLVYTSGVWVLGNTSGPADERSPVNPTELVAWRPAHEQRILETASAGVRAMVVRPGIVYGGGRGIVGELVKNVSNGLARVVGSGENHWPLIYDRDLADLYARLVNTPTASGVYHANDEGDETVNDIVAALAQHASIQPSVRHVPLAEARKKMGPYARRAGARPDRAEPSRAGAGLEPDAPLCCAERAPSVRGMAPQPRGGLTTVRESPASAVFRIPGASPQSNAAAEHRAAWCVAAPHLRSPRRAVQRPIPPEIERDCHVMVGEPPCACTVMNRRRPGGSDTGMSSRSV